MGPVLGVVGNVVYYGLDAAGKVTRDFDATSNIAKIFNLAIQFMNRDLKSSERVLQPLAATLKVVTDCSAIRNWASKVILLISGEAAGVTDSGNAGLIINAKNGIAIGEGIVLPNFLKVSSIACFLVSDILGSLKWLDNLEIINLAKITQGVGSLPLFGQIIAQYTIIGTIGSVVTVGTVLDFAETMRDIVQNGFTVYKATQAVSDVIKVGAVLLTGSTGILFVISIVANTTACFCTLARFVMKNYKIGV